MKTSAAYKKFQDKVTTQQVQELLNTNSLYKVYTTLKISEPLLLRYINEHQLIFSKAFRTLKDLPDDKKESLIIDWKTTLLTKRQLCKKYNIGPKALNRFFKLHSLQDRDKALTNPEFVAYQKLVRRLTSVIIRHYNLKSKPGYEWDHRFSVYQGFHQKINPSLIASLENLELIPAAANRSNGRDCSITQTELINTVCYWSA